MSVQKLKSSLKNRPFCNELIYLALLVVLVILALNKPFFWSLLAIYCGYLYLRKLLLPAFVILLLVIFSYYLNLNATKPDPKGTLTAKFEVLQIKENQVLLKAKKSYLCYIKTHDLAVGDIIEATITIEDFIEKSYEADFDLKNYYRMQGISNRANLKSYTKVGKFWNLSVFKATILKFYKNRLKPASYSYLAAILLGENYLEADLKAAYSRFYLSHILVISGFHIILIYKFLLFICQKFLKVRGEWLALFCLFIYVGIIGFPVAAGRAFLNVFLTKINSYGKRKYSKSDICSLTFILIASLNPLKAEQTGFILSFIVSFVLLLKPKLIKFKGTIADSIMTSILANLVALPLIININYEISLLGILLATFLSLFYTKALLLLVVLSMVFPIEGFEIFYEAINSFLVNTADFLPLIPIKYLELPLILFYYLLLAFAFYLLYMRRKLIFIGSLYFIFLFLICSLRYLDSHYVITFVDVGQGDSILIEEPHNKAVTLIDCFTGCPEFIKSQGIRKIDALFLTHFDNDHVGAVESLLEFAALDKIYYSEFEDLSKLKFLNKLELIPLKAGCKIKVGSINFDVLSPIEKLSSSNANSLALRFDVSSTRFLLMGDCDIKAEEKMVKKYHGLLDSDILKVGHHGSNTSSSNDFLKYVTPKASIISVGKNNYYGHPHQEVLETLQSYGKIYQTCELGNITIRINTKVEIFGYRKNTRTFLDI